MLRFVYLVEPHAMALQVLFALIPMVALTVISIRMGRHLAWVAAPWAIVVLFVTLDLAVTFYGQPKIYSVWVLPTLSTAVSNGAAVAVVIYAVLLAIVGPKPTQKVAAA